MEFNKDRFNRFEIKFNRLGFDKDGFDKDGFDKDGFNIDGFGREGFNRNGFDREGFNKCEIEEKKNTLKLLENTTSVVNQIKGVLESYKFEEAKKIYQQNQQYIYSLKSPYIKNYIERIRPSDSNSEKMHVKIVTVI